MRRSRTANALILLGAGLVLAAGCKPRAEEPAVEQPPAVNPPATPSTPTLMSIDLGKAIGPDMKVVNQIDAFGPRDTIYASITTSGTMPNANVTARWSFEDGQIVDSTTQTLNLDGMATHEFHITKPTRWPAGKYKVEILLNGSKIGEEDFEVKQ